MENPELMKILEHTAHEFLMWVGFGTLVGLTAKAIMPGRDPGGAVGTLMMGIVGSVVGCGVLAFIDSGYRVSPISPLGFVAGTAGHFSCWRFTGCSTILILSKRSTAQPSKGLLRPMLHAAVAALPDRNL